MNRSFIRKENLTFGNCIPSTADNDKMAAARIALVYLAGNAPAS